MKLLFDQNISFRLVNRILDLFPEAEQVRELGLENSTDKEIWNYAQTNGFAVVTFDVDFYDYSVMLGHPPKVIWIRTGNLTTNKLEKVIRAKAVVIKDFISESYNELTEVSCLKIS